MTAPHSQQIVEGYLARLDRELRDRGVAGRAELLAQVESHIAEARAALGTETDADLLNILDRLGSPDSVAEGAPVAGRHCPNRGTATPDSVCRCSHTGTAHNFVADRRNHASLFGRVVKG